jgi:hypothetical protein
MNSENAVISATADVSAFCDEPKTERLLSLLHSVTYDFELRASGTALAVWNYTPESPFCGLRVCVLGVR